MRTIKLLIIIPCIAFLFSACEKDNYAQPDSSISGALTDAEIGGPMSFSKNGGDGGTLRFLVNDPSRFPSPSNLDMTMKADGTYLNTRVFPENYKVWLVDAAGPYKYTKLVAPAYAPTANPLSLLGDTILVNVPSKGMAVTNFKVYPHFRITLSMVDTQATVTITRSAYATFANNNLTATGNLSLYVNNYSQVNDGTSGNTEGKYYVNRWNFNINNTTPAGQTWDATNSVKTIVFGTPFTLPVSDILKTVVPPATVGAVQMPGVKWWTTHWPKGTYYWRVSCVGAGSSGKSNWSNTVQAVVH